MYRLPIVFLVIISVSICLLGCGGEDSSDTSSVSFKESARVVGTVEQLLITSAPENKKSLLADIKALFSLVMSANAQDGELCGILVKAIQNGVVVATGETNCEGNFELNDVPEGPTTLMFETELFSNSVFINVPAGGTLDIKVSLNETEVTVNKIDITTGPVICEGGVLNIGNDDINELSIIGNGGSCVDIAGSCDVSIIAQNINLKECEVCINAVNGAFVSISASEEFDCNADKVGINSTGDSVVTISGDKCTIESGGFQIFEGEGGDVDTENCKEVELEGPDGEDGGAGDDGEEVGDDDDGHNPGNKNLVCEYECSGNNCELFCTNGIPGECVNSCENSDNISLCIQECADIECGGGVCKETCVDEGEPVCEIVEKEVCELKCEGECEEECVKFRKEEVLNVDCFEGCLNSECEGLEGGPRETCIDEHEAVCRNECTQLVETDDCIEFEVVGCECEEVCEVKEVEVCKEVCEKEGIICRFECEEINI